MIDLHTKNDLYIRFRAYTEFLNCPTILLLMAAWRRGSREKGSCEGVGGWGKSKEGGERVWKEGGGCERRDEDVGGGGERVQKEGEGMEQRRRM